MVKTISSKISDPRPRLNVTLQSDDEKTEAFITKGYVNIQRGHKKAILRVPYGELSGVIELAEAAKEVLEKNSYDTTEGSDIAANAEPADATEEPAGAPGNAEDAGVVSAATEGAGAPEVGSVDASPAPEERSDEDRAAAVDARNEQQATGNPFAS